MESTTSVDYVSVALQVKSKVRQEALKECLKLSFNDPKIRIPDESLLLVGEIVQKLAIEASLRGAKQAMRDHQTSVEMEQIEKILPQLMLDFP